MLRSGIIQHPNTTKWEQSAVISKNIAVPSHNGVRCGHFHSHPLLASIHIVASIRSCDTIVVVAQAAIHSEFQNQSHSFQSFSQKQASNSSQPETQSEEYEAIHDLKSKTTCNPNRRNHHRNAITSIVVVPSQSGLQLSPQSFTSFAFETLSSSHICHSTSS